MKDVPSADQVLDWMRANADAEGNVTGVRNYYFSLGVTLAQLQGPRRRALKELEDRGDIERIGSSRNSSWYRVLR